MLYSALQRLSFFPSYGSIFVQSLVSCLFSWRWEKSEMFVSQTWRSPHYICLILLTRIRSNNHTLVRGRLKIQSRLDGQVKKENTDIGKYQQSLPYQKTKKKKKNNKTFKRTKTCSLLNIFLKKYIHFFKKMTSNYCPFYNFTNSYICHWSSNYKIRLYSINIC